MGILFLHRFAPKGRETFRDRCTRIAVRIPLLCSCCRFLSQTGAFSENICRWGRPAFQGLILKNLSCPRSINNFTHWQNFLFSADKTLLSLFLQDFFCFLHFSFFCPCCSNAFVRFLRLLPCFPDSDFYYILILSYCQQYFFPFFITSYHIIPSHLSIFPAIFRLLRIFLHYLSFI